MKKTGIFILWIFMLPAVAFARQDTLPGDTLTLAEAVNLAIEGHPTLQAASRAVTEAEGRIGLARSAYLPTVSAGASYTRIGPVPSFDFPGFGNIKLYPEDNYSAEVTVHQLITDFGRTSRSIEVAEAARELTMENMNMVRQNLAMNVITTYYGLLMAQESIRITDDELKNLNDHLEFIRKKEQTGSATDYQILSTRVKISAVENQRVDLVTGKETLSAVMNALLGRPVDRRCLCQLSAPGSARLREHRFDAEHGPFKPGRAEAFGTK